jgi:hypothetical protein
MNTKWMPQVITHTGCGSGNKETDLIIFKIFARSRSCPSDQFVRIVKRGMSGKRNTSQRMQNAICAEKIH